MRCIIIIGNYRENSLNSAIYFPLPGCAKYRNVYKQRKKSADIQRSAHASVFNRYRWKTRGNPAISRSRQHNEYDKLKIVAWGGQWYIKIFSMIRADKLSTTTCRMLT